MDRRHRSRFLFPRLLRALLILPISVSLALPSSAWALRPRLVGTEELVQALSKPAAGAEETSYVQLRELMGEYDEAKRPAEAAGAYGVLGLTGVVVPSLAGVRAAVDSGNVAEIREALNTLDGAVFEAFDASKWLKIDGDNEKRKLIAKDANALQRRLRELVSLMTKRLPTTGTEELAGTVDSLQLTQLSALDLVNWLERVSDLDRSHAAAELLRRIELPDESPVFQEVQLWRKWFVESLSKPKNIGPTAGYVRVDCQRALAAMAQKRLLDGRDDYRHVVRAIDATLENIIHYDLFVSEAAQETLQAANDDYYVAQILNQRVATLVAAFQSDNKHLVQMVSASADGSQNPFLARKLHRSRILEQVAELDVAQEALAASVGIFMQGLTDRIEVVGESSRYILEAMLENQTGQVAMAMHIPELVAFTLEQEAGSRKAREAQGMLNALATRNPTPPIAVGFLVAYVKEGDVQTSPGSGHGMPNMLLGILQRMKDQALYTEPVYQKRKTARASEAISQALAEATSGERPPSEETLPTPAEEVEIEALQEDVIDRLMAYTAPDPAAPGVPERSGAAVGAISFETGVSRRLGFGPDQVVVLEVVPEIRNVADIAAHLAVSRSDLPSGPQSADFALELLQHVDRGSVVVWSRKTPEDAWRRVDGLDDSVPLGPGSEVIFREGAGREEPEWLEGDLARIWATYDRVKGLILDGPGLAHLDLLKDIPSVTSVAGASRRSLKTYSELIRDELSGPVDKLGETFEDPRERLDAQVIDLNAPPDPRLFMSGLGQVAHTAYFLVRLADGDPDQVLGDFEQARAEPTYLDLYGYQAIRQASRQADLLPNVFVPTAPLDTMQKIFLRGDLHRAIEFIENQDLSAQLPNWADYQLSLIAYLQMAMVKLPELMIPIGDFNGKIIPLDDTGRARELLDASAEALRLGADNVFVIPESRVLRAGDFITAYTPDEWAEPIDAYIRGWSDAEVDYVAVPYSGPGSVGLPALIVQDENNRFDPPLGKAAVVTFKSPTDFREMVSRGLFDSLVEHSGMLVGEEMSAIKVLTIQRGEKRLYAIFV